MTPQEQVLAKKTARVIRAARKQAGLRQTVVARELGISQSALSKVEAALLIPSVHHWFEFCRITHTPLNAPLEGYLDQRKPLQLRDVPTVGSFKLPRRYASDCGASVREINLVLKYSAARMGEANLREYLKQVKVDPDFFITMDNQINLEFCLDLSRHLARQGYLKAKDVKALVKPFGEPATHGNIRDFYDGLTSPLDLVDALVRNSRYYDCDFRYHVEERKPERIVLSSTPEAHLARSAYKSDSELGGFLCEVKKSSLERFSQYGSSSGASISELQCLYREASSCVYEMRSKA